MVADTVKRKSRPGPLPFPVFEAGHLLTEEEASVVISFGIALRAMRDDAEVSRVDFAAQLGSLAGVVVPVDAITSWEAGRRIPPAPLAFRFGRALGFDDHEYLVRAAEVHQSRTRLLANTEKARVETLKALDEDGRPPRARRRSTKKGS